MMAVRKYSAAAARLVLAMLIALSAWVATAGGAYTALADESAPPRQMEHLTRAPVAIMTEEGIYVGWRLLGTDPTDIAFNVYRDGVKLNSTPLTESTNYLDPDGTIDSVYEIRPVILSEEQPESSTTTVWARNYLDIPIRKPADGTTPNGETYTYHANDGSVGDLDGDGQYEIVIKWQPSNAKDNSQSGYTGETYLDAYKLDGTFLWRINLGINIRSGAHYTQFLVYDLDGDGRAEVVAKTADGTVDGGGHVIGDPNADYRNTNGYVLNGPEYLTVFDGRTGRAITTVDYDPPRGNVSDWGDNYGNRVDRFLAGVAYLDGVRPSIIMARGYYTRTVLVAYNFENGQLRKLWRFDTNDPGYGSWTGQGYHSLSIADVDGDGKDEIIYGQITIDHDGSGLYNSGLGHGDALHVGDFIPSRPGLEIFAVQENAGAPYGYDMRDARTGEILWGYPTGQDTGRGLTADIDPRYEGAEAWAIRGEWNSTVGGLHRATGEKIADQIPSTNFAIWWDGDLLRELLDHEWNDAQATGVGKIDKWDYENLRLVNLLKAEGTLSNNHTKGTPVLQADLLGDWREEVIWRTVDSNALRLYTTTDLTDTRIYTLMHDPQYRLAIAWQNVGYNQPPHPSFFIGVGMEEPPIPNIVTKRGTGSVSGWVTNGGDKRIRDATVRVTIGGKDYTTQTNAHGYFMLQGLPQADYAVLYGTKNGCRPTTMLLGIDGSVERDFNLYCPVTSIEFKPYRTTMLQGETQSLSVTLAPEEAGLHQIGWTSSDPEIASVDENGVVTAHEQQGTVTITAYSIDDQNVKATAFITVNAIAVEELILDRSVLNLLVGTTKRIDALVLPDNAYNKRIIWQSSDPDIASVDEQGQVTGVSVGTAVITATTESGGLTESVIVNVQSEPVAVTGINVEPKAVYVRSDHFSELNPDPNPPVVRLSAEVKPLQATNNDVTWSSHDPEVATVDSLGRVTALSSGTARITARTVEGSHQDSARVYVPIISESFENRNEGDTWGSSTGTAGGVGYLGSQVATVGGNKVFQLSGGGTGVRSTQKQLSQPVVADTVLIDLEWNVVSPVNSTGAQLSFEDSNGMRYLTLQHLNGNELAYATGGTASNTPITGTPVGTGFTRANALYRVQVALNFDLRTIDLKITNMANEQMAEVKGIPFDEGTTYADNFARIQFVLVRPSSVTTSWTTWIDNFNVYAYAAEDRPGEPVTPEEPEEPEQPEEPEGHWAKAKLSGTSQAEPGQSITLDLSVTDVVYGFTVLDVVVSFDPSRIEYDLVQDGSTWSLADGSYSSNRAHLEVLATAVRPEEGQIRLIAGVSGEEHAIQEDGSLITLHGKVKADAPDGNAQVSILQFEVSRGGISGTVDLTGASIHTINVSSNIPTPQPADKTALAQAISEAENLLNSTQEGNKLGQYRTGSKAELQSAIDAARAVHDRATATQGEVDQATADLNATISHYRSQFISMVEGQTKITIRDLSIVARYFGTTSSDPDWSEIEVADLFDEGVIDIRVLAAIARMILEDWTP